MKALKQTIRRAEVALYALYSGVCVGVLDTQGYRNALGRDRRGAGKLQVGIGVNCMGESLAESIEGANGFVCLLF